MLNQRLSSAYSDLIYNFVDSWDDYIVNQINKLNGATKSSLLLGKIEPTNLVVSYDFNQELDSAGSKVIFNFQDKTYNPFQQKLYLVSLANNPNQLMRIEELTDKEEKKSFVKCSLSDIENLLHLYKE